MVALLVWLFIILLFESQQQRDFADVCSSSPGRAAGVQRGRDQHDGRPVGGRLPQRRGAAQPGPAPLPATHRPRLPDGGRHARACSQGGTGHTQRGGVPGAISIGSLGKSGLNKAKLSTGGSFSSQDRAKEIESD